MRGIRRSRRGAAKEYIAENAFLYRYGVAAPLID
jgi:hypothetical protein